MTYTLKSDAAFRSERQMRASRHMPTRRRHIATLASSESEENRRMRRAERDLSRVLDEWCSDDGRMAKKLPPSVDELVRAYCIDYERREKEIKANEAAKRQHELEMAQRSTAISDCFKSSHQGRDDNQDSHCESESKGADRRIKRCARSFHFKGRYALPATLVSHYRTVNALIDYALQATCEEGVRETMRHDIAKRRGDRRTTLYYMDRRAYLRTKRRAKLAIAAVLGML